MKRILFFIILLWSLDTLGCNCASNYNGFFLRQVQHFNLIIEGTAIATTDSQGFYTQAIVIDKVLKGEPESDTLYLVDSSCGLSLAFDKPTKLIVGLDLFYQDSQGLPFYATSGCRVSALFLTKKKYLLMSDQALELRNA